MSVEIRTLGSDTVEWDAFVRMSDDGSPFHLTAWKRAVEDTFGFRSHYLEARRGGRLEGVLPLIETRGLFGEKALVSVPYAVYGGVCSTSDAASRALIEAAETLGRERRVAYVELRQRRDLGLGLATKSLYVSFARAIAKSDEENALAIPRKQRRMTRLGQKQGLGAFTGLHQLDRAWDIYAESVRNLGSPVFPRRLFHAIAEHFGKDADVLGVWHGDRMLAGVLTLFYEDQVLPYYGGDLRVHDLPGLADFMYWELLCHAARAGYRVFDFGRSREGTGAYDFKRHWGFEPVPLPYQYLLVRATAVPNHSPSNPKFRLATDLWKRLPLSVTNRVGPIITRYLP